MANEGIRARQEARKNLLRRLIEAVPKDRLGRPRTKRFERSDRLAVRQKETRGDTILAVIEMDGVVYDAVLDRRRPMHKYGDRQWDHPRRTSWLCPECRCVNAHAAGCARPPEIRMSARAAAPKANASKTTWRRFAAHLLDADRAALLAGLNVKKTERAR